MSNHSRIGWTTTPVTTANSNRDGRGTLTRVLKVVDDESSRGQYVDSVICTSFGTNVATEGVLIGTNGNDLSNTKNNFLILNKALAATTLGQAKDTDIVIYQIGTWYDAGFEIWALVHDLQAAGRQFTAYSDPTYQQF